MLEITEREAVRDLSRLREVLDAYRNHDIRFALDDVGEGFSTFELLAAATPEYVKLSARLARRIEERGPRAAVRALVTFAEATGIDLIAEGIETADEAQRLLDIGVRYGQGYALAAPCFASPDQRQAASAAV